MTSSKSTTTQIAYEQVRGLILSGAMAPGKKLHINNMADRLEVSAGIVREVFSRLTSENLVISEPQRGFRVAPISASDLIQLTEARIEIERLCLSRAFDIGGADWQERLKAAYRAMTVVPMTDSAGAVSSIWDDAHEEFHAALAAGCENEWLLRIRSGLSVHFRRYRHLSMNVSRTDRGIDDEHRGIADAILWRDRDRALTLLTEHLTTTTNLLLRSLPQADREQVARAG